MNEQVHMATTTWLRRSAPWRSSPQRASRARLWKT